MASHGRVLDLLDDRYLELQDVFGNVESLPTLVPYESYTGRVAVYDMNTSLEVFMALIQDTTARKALETGKELWTWCVQWEVEDWPARNLAGLTHSPKKPRLNQDHPHATADAETQKQKAPLITIKERRVINPALMVEEEMLRTLMDIIHVESSVVPNFIEFMYRWIDFYEGDGKALKAALSWEIPSLWDFDYHPTGLLPDFLKKAVDKFQGNETTTGRIMMREKPDLALLKPQTEENKRLQYREVRFGIQPPQTNEPLPPLANIPRESRTRYKFYAACFKSRRRALHILQEAGITIAQIKNYKQGQTLHPFDTPEDDAANGLKHYYKDAAFAHTHAELVEEVNRRREKQMEIGISNRLAAEAQLAARTAGSEGPSGVPLIPPTPSHDTQPEMPTPMRDNVFAARKEKDEHRIYVVPTPLVGRMKSDLFRGAIDKQAVIRRLKMPPSKFLPRIYLVKFYSSLEPESDEDTNIGEGVGNSFSAINASAVAPRQQPVHWNVGPDDDLALLPPPIPLPRVAPPPLPSQVHGSSQPRSNPLGLTASQQQIPPAINHSGPASDTTDIDDRLAAYVRLIAPEQLSETIPLLRPELQRRYMDWLAATQSPGAVDQTQLPGLPPMGIVSGPATAMMPPATPGWGESAQPGLGSIAAAVVNVNTIPGPTLPILGPPRPPNITVSPPTPANQVHQRPQWFGSHPGVFDVIDPSAVIRRGPPPPVAQQSSSSSILPLVPLVPLSRPAPLPDTWGWPAVPQTQVASQGPTLPAIHPFAQQSTPEDYGRTSRPELFTPSLQYATALRASTTDPMNQFQAGQVPVASEYTQLNPFSSAPRPGIQRNAPSPLTLAPPSPSPFSTLAPSILATSPFLNPLPLMPIQIFYPGVLVPGNLIGPDGLRLGNSGAIETDVLLLGYSYPGSGKITITRAIFLPMGVNDNINRSKFTGTQRVVEMYHPPHNHPALLNGQYMGPHAMIEPHEKSAHQAAYEKLVSVFSLFATSKDREAKLTKRWRVTKGPITRAERGAVWEGYGVYVDRGIEMRKVDRVGVDLMTGLIDDGKEERTLTPREEEIRVEIERLIKEDEDLDEDLDEALGWRSRP